MNPKEQQVALASRWPKRAGAGKKADIEWERIMVQITFAFVIILGYLTSLGVDEARQLTAETEAQKQRNAILEAILTDLKSTELGEARAGWVTAERRSQLERLLRIWAELRAKRRLFALLRQFDKAELIPLSDDLECLPVGKGFAELNEEVSRVFLNGKQEVSLAEVASLLKSVVVRAGFDPSIVSSVPITERLPSEVAALHFDQKVPSSDNLRMLKLQIVSDLEEERHDLSNLQYALVGKIAAARRDRLAELPLPEDVEMEPHAGDLGSAMLDKVLANLKEQMKLLPETADRIRFGVDTAQSGNRPHNIDP